MAFQRARSAEHKEQRADALVDAARSLALESGVRSVTLTEIAQLAGVHVSGVRRYFESREEIFLKLTAEGWTDWATALEVSPAGSLDSALAGTLADRPLFCDLLGHVQVTLERQVSKEKVLDFKTTALDALARIVTVIHTHEPRLDETAAIDLVAAVTSLAGSLWQTANPPPTLAELYRDHPRLKHTPTEFIPRLTRLIHATVTGLIT